MLVPPLPVPIPAPQQRTFVTNIESYVKRVCRRWGITGPDVEDLVQESLAEIVASVRTFQADKADFETWARGVARNVVRRYLRDAKRYWERFSPSQDDIDDHAAPQPSPERCAQRAQARCAIVNAAETAKSEHMQVVTLHVIDGMSHKDIARQMKISPANSEKRYFRGLTHFAECLSGSELLSAMPPSVTGCNDESISFTETPSRWFVFSHYTGQIVAGVLAFLAFVPDSVPLARESRSLQGYAMYRLDKQSGVHDEPDARRVTPDVKPQPASLPSVRVVPKPTRGGDKPTYVLDPAPLPPFKPTEHTSSHRPRGR
jgi:RNA polymerase sigma factor (sigma-70 family)